MVKLTNEHTNTGQLTTAHVEAGHRQMTATESANSSATELTTELSRLDRLLERLRRFPCAGVLLGLLSGIFFATASFIVKKVPYVHPIAVVVSRSTVQLAVYTPVIFAQGVSFKGAVGERWSLFNRGLFGFLSFSMAYYAFSLIPLADASTIVFSAPVYVSIFACVLIGEKCGAFQVVTITVTIIGVVLISKPTFIFGVHESVKDITYRLEGTILSFLSSLCAAFTFVMIRKLQRTPSAVVIWWFSVVSIILGTSALIIFGFAFDHDIRLPDVWSTNEYVWLFCNGMCGVLGQLFLTIALKIEEAGLVSLARTIDIVMAFVFQVAFLEEVVHWTSGLGAAIVCFGVIAATIRKYLMSKPEILDKLLGRKHEQTLPAVTEVSINAHSAERKVSNTILPVGNLVSLQSNDKVNNN